MNDPRDIRSDLDPSPPPHEADELVRLAERLDRERPVPRAAFRGDLRRHLLAREEPLFGWWRPRRLGVAVAGWVAAGGLLLVMPLLGALGAGPFSA